MQKIFKSRAVILDNEGRFLVTRSRGKDIFIAPGGKQEVDETILEALKRELEEELQIQINAASAEYLGTFEAIAAVKEDTVVEMAVYIVHNYTGEIIPLNEVEEIR